MPLIGPSTAETCGQGYGNQRSEYSMIDIRAWSAASSQLNAAVGR
jgi:hypothetical protein